MSQRDDDTRQIARTAALVEDILKGFIGGILLLLGFLLLVGVINWIW